MELNEDRIREELKKVIDPELFVNIIDLGLVYTVQITPLAEEAAAGPLSESLVAEAPIPETPVSPSPDSAASPPSSDIACDSQPVAADAADGAGSRHTVVIEMTMTSPACPAGPQLIANSKQVVSRMDGVDSVEVRIVMDPPWSPDRMTEAARDQLGIF